MFKVPYSIHFLRDIRRVFLNPVHVIFLSTIIEIRLKDGEISENDLEHLDLLVDYVIEKKYAHQRVNQ